MTAPVPDEEIAAALARLPGWQQERSAIRRVYEFPEFFEAMKFVHRIADLALAAKHDSQILIDGRRVSLTLTTPAAGGVTSADLELARRIDRVL